MWPLLCFVLLIPLLHLHQFIHAILIPLSVSLVWLSSLYSSHMLRVINHSQSSLNIEPTHQALFRLNNIKSLHKNVLKSRIGYIRYIRKKQREQMEASTRRMPGSAWLYSGMVVPVGGVVLYNLK